MATQRPPQRKAQQARPALTRWLWVMGASLLLHWLMLEWGTAALHSPTQTSDDPSIIQTTLIAPPKAKPIAPAIVKPAVRKKPAKPAAPSASKAAARPSTETAPEQTFNRSAARTISAADLAAARASVAGLAPATALPDTSISAEDSTVENGDAIDFPPSAELKYDVQKTAKNDEALYGHGTIRWQTDGRNYSIDGDAGVLFFTVLTFKSAGQIDKDGIAPDLYQEKRFRKPETNTHFDASHNLIHFSYTGKSWPRVGIEQDRISVIWQLAGLGRGGSTRFAAGSEIDLLVAGTRKVSMWRMQVVGQDQIVINGETLSAWHITRIPKKNAQEQKLDLWLAPEKNWYPVRLRYTEDNGDYLDMTLSKLNIN